MHIVHEGQCPVRFITPRCQPAMQSTQLRTKHARLPKAAHHRSSLPGSHAGRPHTNGACTCCPTSAPVRRHTESMCSRQLLCSPCFQTCSQAHLGGLAPAGLATPVPASAALPWAPGSAPAAAAPAALLLGCPSRSRSAAAGAASPLARQASSRAADLPGRLADPPTAGAGHARLGAAVGLAAAAAGALRSAAAGAAPQRRGVTSQQPEVGQPTDPAGKKGLLTGCSRMLGACAVAEPTGVWLPWLQQV